MTDKPESVLELVDQQLAFLFRMMISGAMAVILQIVRIADDSDKIDLKSTLDFMTQNQIEITNAILTLVCAVYAFIQYRKAKKPLVEVKKEVTNA